MLFSVLGGEGQQKLIVPIESSGNWVGDTRNGCRRSRPVSWDYNALGSLPIHKQTYGRCWTKKKEGNETEPAHLVVMANTQDTHRPDGIIIL